MNIPERCPWRRSCVFIVNFEHISRSVSIVNFEQVNAGWECLNQQTYVIIKDQIQLVSYRVSF